MNFTRSETQLTEEYPSRVAELLKSVVVLALLLIVVRLFVFGFHYVTDDGMLGTLELGDVVLVNRIVYSYSDPKPGDIALVRHPLRIDESLVRRIVATEGQTVEIRNKVLLVNNRPAWEAGGVHYSDPVIYPIEISLRDNYGPVQVPSGKVFVMSDNRDEYFDSRDWGFVDLSEIIGKSSFVIFSWAPDPDAPRMESPILVSLLKIAFHSVTHCLSRIGWSRIGATVA